MHLAAVALVLHRLSLEVPYVQYAAYFFWIQAALHGIQYLPFHPNSAAIYKEYQEEFAEYTNDLDKFHKEQQEARATARQQRSDGHQEGGGRTRGKRARGTRARR